MNKRLQITLDDIAKRLNVSKVTVSKALRGHPDISKGTVERVKQVAQELGYTPNYMARNLSSKRSNTIGVVIPKIAHFFFSSVVEAIYDTAFHNNYEIILTVSQENSQREIKHIESLLAMRVDGLIVSITQETRDHTIFERVINSGVPLIFMDRVLDIPGTSSVVVDDIDGSFQAIKHVIELGYKKIAHLAGYPEINIGLNRYLGFEKAMKEYGLSINPEWIITGGFGEEFGYNGFMKLYESKNLPEFIYTVTYPVALGVYAAVEELGLKIPDDIDIMCFGNSDVNRFISPSLSCVNQPTDKIGEASVKLMLEQIKNIDTFEPQHITIPTDLILRESCSRKRVESYPNTSAN